MNKKTQQIRPSRALFIAAPLLASALLVSCSGGASGNNGPTESTKSGTHATNAPKGEDSEKPTPHPENRSPLKPLKLVELAREAVSPSDSAQEFGVKGRIAVEVPGGMLKEPATLSISAPEFPQVPPTKSLKLLGDFEISLGGARSFERELTLSMPADSSRFSSGISFDHQLVGAFWDDGRARWTRVPVSFDEKKGVALIHTRHLSRWAIWYSDVRGFQCLDTYWDRSAGGFWASQMEGMAWYGDTVWFRLYYDPVRDSPVSMKNELPGCPPARPSSFVMSMLLHCYDRYREAGFRVPVGIFDVFLDSSLTGAAAWDSTWCGIDNIMYIPGDLVASGVDEARQTVAHELFHAVQNQYINAPIAMTLRSWWMEATANYAAGRVAWAENESVWNYGIRFVKSWYPEAPLSYFTNITIPPSESAKSYDDAARLVDMFHNHQYETCLFVDFIVGERAEGRSARFRRLWDESISAWFTAAYQTPVEDGIEQYLSKYSNESLAWCYTRFALKWYFERCPSPEVENGKVPEARKKNTYDIGTDGECSIQIALDGGFSCQFLHITGDAGDITGVLGAKRTPVLIEAVSIPKNVVVVPNNVFEDCALGLADVFENAAIQNEGTLPKLEAGKPHFRHLNKAFSLCLLAINTGKVAQMFTVNIKRFSVEVRHDGGNCTQGVSSEFRVVSTNLPPGVKYVWDFWDGTKIETTKTSVAHTYSIAAQSKPVWVEVWVEGEHIWTARCEVNIDEAAEEKD